MVTKRDRIWNAAMELSERRGSFTVSDVLDTIEDSSPSRRTVQDCLSSMESLGLLESEGGQGSAPQVFYPPTPMPDGGGDRTESQQPADNHVSVFPYPGGKGRQSEWLINKMPPHDTYVEVFGGSGAVLYNKPTSKNEIYNDVNEDLTQFFSVLRTREDELIEWLQAVPYSRSLYNEWVEAFYSGERPDDPVARAGRFFALRYMQFAGDISMTTGFKVRSKRSPARSFSNARKRLYELAERFEDVIIENRDYQRILDTYEDTDVDVLFYLDPPYVDSEHYYQSEFDHSAFAEALRDVDGYWMVSYSDLPEVLAAGDYHVLERERRHRMGRGDGDTTERLVCNFDPAEMSRFVSQDIEQTRLGE